MSTYTADYDTTTTELVEWTSQFPPTVPTEKVVDQFETQWERGSKAATKWLSTQGKAPTMTGKSLPWQLGYAATLDFVAENIDSVARHDDFVSVVRGEHDSRRARLEELKAEQIAAIEASVSASMTPELPHWDADELTAAYGTVHRYGQVVEVDRGDGTVESVFSPMLRRPIEDIAREMALHFGLHYEQALDQARTMLVDYTTAVDSAGRIGGAHLMTAAGRPARIEMRFTREFVRDPDQLRPLELLWLVMPVNSRAAKRGEIVWVVAYQPDTRPAPDWRTIEQLTGLSKHRAQEVALTDPRVKDCITAHRVAYSGSFHHEGMLGLVACFTTYSAGKEALLALTDALRTIRDADAERAAPTEGTGEPEQRTPSAPRRIDSYL